MARCTLICAILIAGCVRCGSQQDQRASMSDGLTKDAPVSFFWRGQESYGLEGTPQAGGKLVIHLEVEPQTLTPCLTPDVWGMRMVSHQVLQTLVREDPRTGNYVPELAERWEVQAGTSYTFHLRRGVRWHDGQPMTAYDVQFSFDLYTRNPRFAYCGAILAPVKSWEAVDLQTFQVVLKAPQFNFLSGLDELQVLPAHIWSRGDPNQNKAARAPLGTGPYRFGRWTTGQEIVFERNSAYWGKPAHPERLVFKYVQNPVVALQLARKGEIDFLPRVREAQWVDTVQHDQVLKRDFVRLEDWPNNFSYLVLNTSHPLFADRRVRKAMAHLLDRSRILRDVMYGLGKLITGPYYVHSPSYHPTLKPIAFDPQKAGQLLDEAGWKDTDGDGVRDHHGQPLRFTFLATAASTTLLRWATVYQEDLRKAGVQMEISPIEWAQFLERLRQHKFEMAALVALTQSRVDDRYEMLHSSQVRGGQNYAGYQNAALDRLLEQIRGELVDERRYVLEHRVAELMAYDVPVIFLFMHPYLGLVHRKVRGVYASPEWYQLPEWWIANVP